MRLTRLSVLFVAAASSLCASRFAIESVGKIVRVADPQISPDGKTIALVVSRTNFDEDRYDPELVLIDVATRSQRAMTHDRRGLTQPRWSPNGSQLAFLATADGKPQIFLMALGGGDAWQLTKSPAGVQQFAWRPGTTARLRTWRRTKPRRSLAKSAITAPLKFGTTIFCCRRRRGRRTSGSSLRTARARRAASLPATGPYRSVTAGIAFLAAFLVARRQTTGDRQGNHALYRRQR